VVVATVGKQAARPLQRSADTAAQGRHRVE
jgi:hypothetical protein